MSQLYDAYGRKIDPGLLKEEQAAPQFGGIRNISGRIYPSINLDPDKLNGILKLADLGDPFLFLELAEEIEEKDNHYLSVLTKRKAATASLELIIDSASNEPADVAIADFVREVLGDETGLNLRNHIFDILDGIGKGFSATEIIWSTEKRIGGDLWWAPTDLKWRDPRWFMFDWVSGEQVLVRSLRNEGKFKDLTASGAIEMLGASHFGGTWAWNTQAARLGLQPLTAPLAPYKFITHLAKAKSGIPIRSGLTRCIAWTYLFRNYAQKDWSMFVERYGIPIRMGKYGAGATDADKNALLAAVASFGTDMAGVIPESMSVEFPSPGSSLAGNVTLFEKYLEYLESLISKVVLGQTLTTQLPGGGGGSRAAAHVHRGVERDVMEGDAKRVEATLNRDLVRPLVDLNYGTPPSGRYPKLRLGLPDDEDISAWTKSITELAGSGFEIGENIIRQKLKIPKPEPGEKILTPPQKATVRAEQVLDEEREPEPEEVARHASDSTRRARGTSPAVIGDAFAEKLREDHWREVMDPLVEPIIKEIQAAHSYEDLKHRLRRVAAKMDPTAFADLMQRALFNAHLAGRWTVRKKK